LISPQLSSLPSPSYSYRLITYEQVINYELLQKHQKLFPAEYWWLMPVILATWEAKIGRIEVRGKLGHIVLETSFPK
jgi:hypothetical protein